MGLSDTEDFEFDMDEPVFTTTVVTRLIGVPVWVLKQLDREQLVSPPDREPGETRLYSKRNMMHLKKVWHYMSIKKVNVHGLKVIVEMNEDFFSV